MEKLSLNVVIELNKMKDPKKDWNVETLSQKLGEVVLIKDAYQLSSYANIDSEEQTKQRVEQNQHLSHRPRQNNMSAHTFATLTEEKRKITSDKNSRIYPCAFCSGQHLNDQCSTYKNLEERKKRVAQNELCFRCLRPGHRSKDCRFNRPCAYCQGNHNRALCQKMHHPANHQTGGLKMMPTCEFTPTSTAVFDYQEAGNKVSQTENHTSLSTSDPICEEKIFATKTMTNTFLLTTEVIAVNPRKHELSQKICFFDTGSQRSYMRNDLKKNLKLVSDNEEILSVQTFASTNPQNIKSSQVKALLQLENGIFEEIQTNTVPVITEKLSSVILSLEDEAIVWKTCGKTTATENLVSRKGTTKPDMLIGMDYFWHFVQGPETGKLPSGLFIVQSKFGPLICGKSQQISTFAINHGSTIAQVATNIRQESSGFDPKNLQEFWTLESIGIIDKRNEKDDEIAKKRFLESIQFENVRYQVRWPWKVDSPFDSRTVTYTKICRGY